MWQMFKILPTKIKLYFFSGILLVILNVAITMVLPILISQFIPILVPNETNSSIATIEIFKNISIYTGPKETATTILLVATLSGIALAALTSFLSVLIIIWAGENASNFYRDYLFRQYQKFSLKDIATLTSESLITRINDDVAVFWEFLVNSSTSLIKAPLFIIFGTIFAFWTDVNFAYTIVVIIPVLIGIFMFIFLKSNPLIKKNRKNLDAITKESEETIVGVKFIRAYNLQTKQRSKFLTANSKWLTNETKIFKLFSLGTPTFFTTVNLIIVAIFIMAAYMINEGDRDPQLLARINVFIEYEFILATGIIIFAQFIGSVLRAKISAKRITEVFNWKYEDLNVTNGYKITDVFGQVSDAKNYSVEFKNLNFKYFDDSQDYALKNINFKIQGGQTLGIIGPTGAGKSTIANLLVNNMKFTNGSILINNKDIRDLDTTELHQKVGIVYQDALLYSGSIKQNLQFALPNATTRQMERALHNACALDFIKTLPNRLDQEIAQRGKNLSGGQKQRLSIARTLLIDPKILILDDSTSALDNLTTKKLIQNIKQDYNCTTIIISQKINSIKHANLILVMDAGEIIASGTHEELLKTCEWYKEVNNNQLRQ